MAVSLDSIMSGSYYGVSSGFFDSMTASGGSSNVLGDYASIRSGSYYKLMKSYYGGSETAKTLVGDKLDSVETATNKKNKISVRDDASELKKSAEKLLQTGSKSLFNKVTMKGEDGEETEEYDMDQIYEAVSSFVEDYNSLISSAGDSESKSVLSSTASMVNNTKVNEKMLNSIGIKIGKDNKLTIDEEDFKEADVNAVKSLFNGAGSYGYNVSSSASKVYNQSVSELAKMAGSSYSSAAGYQYVSAGSMYNAFL